MTLQYEDIFSRFLSKITDYSFLEYDDGITREKMVSWLRSAYSDSRIRKKFSVLLLNDEDAELNFTLSHPTDEQFDKEFVTNLFATAMTVAWVEPQVKNVLLTMQLLTGGDEKFYAQSNHLAQLRQLLSDSKTDLKSILRDYGYIHNSYIGG